MGVSGDVSKGIIIFAVGFWIYLIVQFIVTSQFVFALLLFVGLIIPISFVAFEYRRNLREFQCKKCKHNFKVSYLKLLFTRKLQEKDTATTGTVSYNLECPKCGEKVWLVALQ